MNRLDQDVVALLTKGKEENAAAKALMEFMGGAQRRRSSSVMGLNWNSVSRRPRRL